MLRKLAKHLLRTVPAAQNPEEPNSIRGALTTGFMKPKKLYQDLTIDEPLPHDPVIEAAVDAMTPEQTKASIESAWFTNPGGHFRRRILKKLERAGLVRFIKAPDDGREQMQFAVAEDPRIPPEQQLALKLVVDLIKAVDGALDDPYDPNRTRADYEPDGAIALFDAVADQLGRTPTKDEWLAELSRIKTRAVQ